MQAIGWPAEPRNPIQAVGGPALPEGLLRAAWGEAALDEALLTLANHQEHQARTSADLLERETWALTAIMELSAPIWRQLLFPTLRFGTDSADEPHLELGHFAHLATLVAPRAGEPASMAATTPRWARVFTCRKQQQAGQVEVLARTYEPISVAEAVATLGFGRILSQIEVATRTAGQALLEQEQSQRERRARLLRVERMLGWEPDHEKTPDRGTGARTRLALLLGEAGSTQWAPGAALVALAVILVSLLFGIPQAVLALIVGGGGLLLRAILSA
jgi:hypothetical protein